MIRVNAYAQYKALFKTGNIDIDINDLTGSVEKETGEPSFSLREILQLLNRRYPDLQRYLLLHDGTSFRNHAMILADGNIKTSLDAVIPDGSTLEIFPVFIGG